MQLEGCLTPAQFAQKLSGFCLISEAIDDFHNIVVAITAGGHMQMSQLQKQPQTLSPGRYRGPAQMDFQWCAAQFQAYADALKTIK